MITRRPTRKVVPRGQEKGREGCGGAYLKFEVRVGGKEWTLRERVVQILNDSLQERQGGEK